MKREIDQFDVYGWVVGGCAMVLIIGGTLCLCKLILAFLWG